MDRPRTVGLALDRFWWLAVLAVAFLYVVTVPRMWQCEGVDEIEYLHLAHSLDRGWGYRLDGQPYGLYPPAFPALLGLLMQEGEIPWRLLYTVNGLLGLAGLVVLATALRRHGGEAGLWASWFALGSYYAWSFSTRFLLAEPLMVCASAVALAATLEAQSTRWRLRWMLLAIGALALAVMTKASAIALTAAMAAACGVAFLRHRQWAWMVFALVVAVAGFGLQAAWEWRAATVASSSEETYLRWMLRLVGLSDGGGGIVARNAGEGVVASAPLWERAGWLWVSATRQLFSIVRSPDNVAPLAVLLGALFLVGVSRGIRRRPESPLLALCLLSLAMFSATRWVSSYPRYLYTIAPLLFFYVLDGAIALRDARSRAATRVAALVALAIGAWGVFEGLATRGPVAADGGEGAYVRALGAGLTLLYGAVAAAGAWLLVRGEARIRPGAWRLGVIALLVSTSLHSLVLAAARYRRTLDNETLRMRNLEGSVHAGRWIATQTDRDSHVVASFPRLATFLANRRAVGELPSPDAGGVSFVLLVGELREVPAFRARAEEALAQAVRTQEWPVVFESGGASVVRASHE